MADVTRDDESTLTLETAEERALWRVVYAATQRTRFTQRPDGVMVEQVPGWHADAAVRAYRERLPAEPAAKAHGQGALDVVIDMDDPACLSDDDGYELNPGPNQAPGATGWRLNGHTVQPVGRKASKTAEVTVCWPIDGDGEFMDDEQWAQARNLARVGLLDYLNGGGPCTRGADEGVALREQLEWALGEIGQHNRSASHVTPASRIAEAHRALGGTA